MEGDLWDACTVPLFVRLERVVCRGTVSEIRTFINCNYDGIGLGERHAYFPFPLSAQLGPGRRGFMSLSANGLLHVRTYSEPYKTDV